MILSDSQIRAELSKGTLKIDSPVPIEEQIGPASLDFRLGNTFSYYKKDGLTLIDPKKSVDPKHIHTVTINDDTPFILHPRQFVLGVTLEKITLPTDLVARCEWRSSIGRLGIIIHSTAGYIDPGFSGTITLEITNINEIPIALYPNMRIGQFAFERIEGTVDIPYHLRPGSKYMWQELPQISRIDQDFSL